MSAIWMVSRAPRRADGPEFRRDETALRHRAELFLPGDASCQVNTRKSKTNSAGGRFCLPKDEITEAEKQRAFRGEIQVRQFCRARVFSACPVPGMCPCRGNAGAAADVGPESARSAAHSQPLSRSSETAAVCRGLCRVLTRPVSRMYPRVPRAPMSPTCLRMFPRVISLHHLQPAVFPPWGGGKEAGHALPGCRLLSSPGLVLAGPPHGARSSLVIATWESAWLPINHTPDSPGMRALISSPPPITTDN